MKSAVTQEEWEAASAPLNELAEASGDDDGVVEVPQAAEAGNLVIPLPNAAAANGDPADDDDDWSTAPRVNEVVGDASPTSVDSWQSAEA